MRYIIFVCLSVLMDGCIPGFPPPPIRLDVVFEYQQLSDEEIIESLNEDPLISNEINTNVGPTFACCQDFTSQ